MEKPNLFSRPTIQYAAAVLLPVLAVAGGVLYFGSTQRLVAALDGQLLIVKESQFLFENNGDQSFDTAKFVIENISGADVRIVGCRAACSCITLTDLPVVIAAGQDQELNFRVTGSRDVAIDESITLFTIPPGTPVVLHAVSEPPPTVASPAEPTVGEPVHDHNSTLAPEPDPIFESVPAIESAESLSEETLSSDAPPEEPAR